MNATVCPGCQTLLTSRERAMAKCPKCHAALPELPEVRTLSDRKAVSRVDLFGSRSFAWRMAMTCTGLALVTLIAGCLSLQHEQQADAMTISQVISSVLSIVVLIASVVAGYFGLTGGIRGIWTDCIAMSAIGLILAGVQLAFWFVSFSGFFA